MKITAILFTLLIATSFCQAQTFTMNQGGTDSKNYFEEIPYQDVNGKMFVEVMIGGKKHKFLFDTGATVAVSNAIVADLHLELIHKGTFTDVNRNTDSTEIVEVNDLHLGGLTFNHVPAVTLIPDFYACWGVDGVIGSNLLRGSIVSMSAARHIITLTDQLDKLNLKSKNSGPLIANARQSDPSILIVLKNKLRLTIPFDSGDSGFLRMSDDMLTRFSKYGVFDTVAKGYGASGVGAFGLQKAASKYLVKVPFLTIASARFDGLVTETNKNDIPAIGSKILEYGTFTLDFIHGKFYFDPINPNTTLDSRQWPFEPSFAADKLIIGVAWDTADPRLKPGDQILAIDDRDYSHVTLCDMLNNRSQLYKKDSVVVTVKNEKGEVVKVTVERK